MVTLADSLVLERVTTSAAEHASGLVRRYRRYQGQPYWVIKEPIWPEVLSLPGRKVFILRENCWTGTARLTTSNSGSNASTLQKISLVCGTLYRTFHRSGLLITDAEGQGMQLRKRRDEKRCAVS